MNSRNRSTSSVVKARLGRMLKIRSEWKRTKISSDSRNLTKLSHFIRDSAVGIVMRMPSSEMSVVKSCWEAAIVLIGAPKISANREAAIQKINSDQRCDGGHFPVGVSHDHHVAICVASRRPPSQGMRRREILRYHGFSFARKRSRAPT